MYHATRRAQAIAKTFRHAPTPYEARIWRWLRDRRFCNWKFRRQYPIGPYIADFYCAELKLVIELDGSFHRNAHDRLRDRRFKSIGITVLRISNRQIDEDEIAVADGIVATAKALEQEMRAVKTT